MRYLLNYVNGACQWAEAVDLGSMASLLSAGVLTSLVDTKTKKALIINQAASQEGNVKNIGWAEIPQYGAYDSKEIELLED